MITILRRSGIALPWLIMGASFVAAAHLLTLMRNDFFALTMQKEPVYPANDPLLVTENSHLPHSGIVEVIKYAQLFGDQNVISVEEALDSIETQLDLVLVGTFTHRDPRLASAVIAESGLSPVQYRAGDFIQSNVELFEVRTGSVILKRDARHEVLTLSIITPDRNESGSILVSQPPREDAFPH